jgi:quercetin dioxygenase-like cupin family protein
MESIFWGSFKRARAELGVTSFGMAVIDLPPNAGRYPEHDHAADGQEEVYVALSGAGEIEVEGERHPLDQDTLVRVAAEAKRKVLTGDAPMRLLVIGGIPGKPFQAGELTELGVPDPTAE